MAEVNERRTYGGRTGDERAQMRRDALLDAALELVDRDGWRALTVESLCRTAGLNKRYFYESFADLDAVAGALLARIAEETTAAALAPIDADRPDAEQTRAGVRAFVAHITEDPRRARVLFGALPAGDRGERQREEVLHRLAATVAGVGRNLTGLGADPVVELTAAMIVGGTGQAIVDWLDGRIACSREQLADDLVGLWHALADGAAGVAADR